MAREDQQALFRGVVRAIAAVLDCSDPCGSPGYGHGARVAYMAWELAAALELREAPVVYYAGLVHDIGAANAEEHVTDLALREFGDPTAKSHVALARHWLGGCDLLAPLLPLIDSHHERVDGTGFPYERHAADIPIGASVLHLADAVDIRLRQVPANLALEACKDLVGTLADTAVPRRVAHAALDLLQRRPELVAVMLDASRLAPAHDALVLSYPAVAQRPWAEVVNALLPLLARAADARHDRRMGHSTRVASCAFEIAQQLGDEVVEPWEVAWAGLLHDVGLAGIRHRSLGADPSALSPEDRVRFERHPRDSAEIVAALPGLSHLAPAVAAHHERWDGAGYPHRLAGEHIPLIGRILAYANGYVTLTSVLAGPAPLSHAGAIAKLGEEIGASLDPHLAGAAMAALAKIGVPPRAATSASGLFKAVKVGTTHGYSTPAPPPARRGALLIDVEPWQRAVLSADLEILEGLEALSVVTGRIGSHVRDHLADESAREVLDAWPAIEGESVFSKYVFTPTGLPLEVVVERCGTTLSMLFRSAESRLASLDRLAHFYRNFLGSSEAVVFADPGGNIIDVNRAFLDLFGYQLRDVIGKHTRMLKSDRHVAAFYEHMWATISDPASGTWSGELVDRHREGRELHVHMRINAVRDASGTCLGYIAHHTDISERKRAEAEIFRRDEELHRKNLELERLSQFKTDMVAITSHDLKSPLAAIMGLSTVVRRNLPRLTQESVSAYLDRIAEAARNLIGFVNDLLDVEKIESGTLTLEHGRVLLQPLLEKCAEQARTAAQHRVKVELRVDCAPEPIVADMARLGQVLDNLLGNAIKFAPEGSTVQLCCRDDDHEQVLVTVEDEGPGIPPGQLTAIFDRYVQADHRGAVLRREQGSGLGLSIVRSLVELHGGSVWVENRPRGCRFALRLPTRRGDPRIRQGAALLWAEPTSETSDLGAMIADMDIRLRRVESLSEFRWYCEAEAPQYLFVARAFLDEALAAYLEELRARRPVVRVVLDDRVPEPGDISLLDATLSPPVLDEELSDVLALLVPGAEREP